jgi:hypothetical protein
MQNKLILILKLAVSEVAAITVVIVISAAIINITRNRLFPSKCLGIA